jgi:DNA-binding NtrC family response regulator
MWPRNQPRHPVEPPPALLAVLSNAGERQLVTELSHNNGWSLTVAATLEQAQAGIANKRLAVVLLDRDLGESDWRSMVRSFTCLHPAPCVILASFVSDHYLFEEVIHQGGYDVVSKPLKLEEVSRITRLALTFWKNRLARVHGGL